MTRLAAGRYTAPMRTLIAVLALLPTFALADFAGPARVIDGDTIEVWWSEDFTWGIPG